jgi:SRSO17 transposase
MLPASRQEDYLFEIPAFDIDKNDIEELSSELKGFHSVFSDCFHRSESREHFYNYMAGQLSDIGRKSIEPIALTVEGGNVRSMQRFISHAHWNEKKMEFKYRNMVRDDMGHADGAVIFDESSFVKKGQDSIGVAKQYAGSVGKTENCQVGVFAAYTSQYGYTLINKRLYIPKKWFGEDFKERRIKCGLPEDTVFKTKPELAVEMLDEIASENILPFKYVLADSIYGENPSFIKGVESLPGVTYFVSVGSNTLCWLRQPVTKEKKYKYRGKFKTKRALAAKEKSPISVGEFARSINSFFWYRRTVSEGTKGPITYEFTKRRIVLSKDGLPEDTVWLVIRRTLGTNPEYAYYLSNAMVSTRLATFVWLSGLRWAIEQCFEETKTELGMDHYEVRKFKGWHHHMLVCMLAHFFLWHLMIKMGKKSSIHYFSSDYNSN